MISDPDDDFFEQFLIICMGDKEKLIPFLEFIEELIAIETIQYYNKTGFFKFSYHLPKLALDLKAHEGKFVILQPL